MERSLTILLALFAFFASISALTTTVPLFGLSTILGSSVMGSSVMGSSVMGSSVMASSVMVIAEAQSAAMVESQLWLTLVTIALLVFFETGYSAQKRRMPAHLSAVKPKRELRLRACANMLLELRGSWQPILTLMMFLFLITVALKAWSILAS